jgi:enoyl-[acyl-carrier protein] reductase III
MVMKQRFLDGRVALVTGGTRGIGKATAIALGEVGAKIAINYLKSRTNAEEAVTEMESKGITVKAFRANIGNTEHLDKLVKEVIETYGRIDIFISNAASGPIGKTIGMDVKKWEDAININARSFFYLSNLVCPIMREHGGGKIIAVSSLGAIRSLPGYGALGASKAAIESTIRQLAAELAPYKIIVNGVSAGVTDTESLQAFPQRQEILDHCLKRTPLGRVGTPEDIAPIIRFLCSEDAKWITGQIITADGGYSIVG